MMLTILRYPDPKLSMTCAEVTVFDKNLRVFTDALHAAMIAAPGVGITAAHVGHLVRVVTLDLKELGGRRDYVNPQVLEASDETMEHDEGSVSMPGAIEKVTRPKTVTIRYQDLDGTVHEEQLTGFPAICMQHEIDQLDGIFWLQRLSRLKRERLVKKWQKDRR